MEDENTNLLNTPNTQNSPYEQFNILAPTPASSSGLQAILSYFNLYDSLPPSPNEHQHHQHELTDSQNDLSPNNFVAALTEHTLIFESSRSGLSTWEGVFLPTWLSIWGILVFVRLAYCVGQSGILETLAMFIIGFSIALTTTLSISAIGTNGAVKGGGPYYMISRTLGVEFGGCIGVIFCIGNISGNAMNVFGFLEPLLADYNAIDGRLARILPTGQFMNFVYGSTLLIFCTFLCSFGSKIFAKTSIILFFVISFCTALLLLSFLVSAPFEEGGIEYTSWNSTTFTHNLYSNYTISEVTHSFESFSSIFGILYPSCTGILAGASMSGDLKNPGTSIPKGTLSAIGISFTLYVIITFFIGSTVTRESLITNLTVLSSISVSPLVIKLAIYSAAVFSIVGGIMTTGKILQAMSRDGIIPVMRIFAQGKGPRDEPILAILFVWFASELLLIVGELNLVVPFLTMFTLLSYGIINFACFLLKIASAPNFRPNFVYFHWLSAFFGFAGCIVCMFVVSGVHASMSLVFLILLWTFIHFVSPPKSWGEIQQALIYHQVRKYLLRLDVRKEHVKFWRPQILLLNGPLHTPVPLIEFANSMKKGSLYIIAEVLLAGSETMLDVSLYRKKRLDLMELVDNLHIKAFSELIISQSFREGVRALLMTCGLGGMKPNILLLPWRGSQEGVLMSEQEYINIINDSIHLGKSVAVAKGFDKLKIPLMSTGEYGMFSLTGWKRFFNETSEPTSSSLYIDLYPLLMNDNYNTFMMVLQLGCILHMVPRWFRQRKLRVIGIVENDSLIDGEREKLKILLRDLRIKAMLLIVSLECVGVSKSHEFEADSSSSAFFISSSPDSTTISRPESPVVIRHHRPSKQQRPTPPAHSFNKLSVTSQCEILNRVFRVYSHPDQSCVILSSLLSPKMCPTDYLKIVDVFSRGAGEEEGISMGLPPMMLIYGQGVVVTKNL